jgi:hypothetical protein
MQIFSSIPLLSCLYVQILSSGPCYLVNLADFSYMKISHLPGGGLGGVVPWPIASEPLLSD